MFQALVLSCGPHCIAHPVYHAFDLCGIVTLRHDTDDGFGAGRTDDQPAFAFKLAFCLSNDRL